MTHRGKTSCPRNIENTEAETKARDRKTRETKEREREGDELCRQRCQNCIRVFLRRGREEAAAAGWRWRRRRERRRRRVAGQPGRQSRCPGERASGPTRFTTLLPTHSTPPTVCYAPRYIFRPVEASEKSRRGRVAGVRAGPALPGEACQSYAHDTSFNRNRVVAVYNSIFFLKDVLYKL